MPSHPNAAPTRHELEARIDRVAALIDGARRLLDEHQAFDLTVIGFAAADLRDAVRAAPVDISAGLAPRVVALKTALNALAEEFAAASATAARGVEATARRSAFRAYDSGGGKTDGYRPGSTSDGGPGPDVSWGSR